MENGPFGPPPLFCWASRTHSRESSKPLLPFKELLAQLGAHHENLVKQNKALADHLAAQYAGGDLGKFPKERSLQNARYDIDTPAAEKAVEARSPAESDRGDAFNPCNDGSRPEQLSIAEAQWEDVPTIVTDFSGDINNERSESGQVRRTSKQGSASKERRPSTGSAEKAVFGPAFAARDTTQSVTSSRWDAVHFSIEDPEMSSSKSLAWFARGVKVLETMSVATTFTLFIEPKPVPWSVLIGISAVINIYFIMEASVRVAVYPKKRAFFSTWSSSQVFLLIDVFAAVPFWLLVALGYVDIKERNGFTLPHFMTICVGPLLRLLKMLRYMPNVHLLVHSSFLLFEAVPTILYVMVIYMWLFASIILFFEPADNIHDLPHAMWLVLVTLTTVGYGDVTPTTQGGYLICSLLTVFGSLYFALPIGVLGSIFTKIWNDRDRILLMRTTRARLRQWGYTARDIPELFDQFDSGGGGELDVFQFSQMIHAMNLGFDDQRIDDLFQQMDLDKGGTIDASEFIRILFPKTFQDLYGNLEADDDSNADNEQAPQRDQSGSDCGSPKRKSSGFDTSEA